MEDENLTYFLLSSNTTGVDIDIIAGAWFSVPLLFAYVTLALFGLLGNLLVIGAVLVHRKLRILSNTFLVNLAVADFSVAAVINGFGILGLVNVHFFEDKPALCEVIGIVCVTRYLKHLFTIQTLRKVSILSG